jgi:hypothetical protein
MEKFWTISVKPSSRVGTPPYQLVDEAGDVPSAAAMKSLADHITWLAQDLKDREDASRLEIGKYYWHRRKSGIAYVKFMGVDEIGVRVVFVDKSGTPIDMGYGLGAENHFAHYPVASLVLMKAQPKVFAA